MSKISIVMAHYNRFHLLYNTLTSIYNKHEHNDIQVVVVDDGSKLLTDKEKIFEFPINYIQLPESKWYSNPCIPYNIGIEYSEGDIVIIQNPECYHLDDVITHTINNLKANDYFAYSCYSLPKEADAASITSKSQLNNRGASFDGDNAWYCHSKFRNKPYHFCASTTRKNLGFVKNFSREYAYGVGYDDDDLVYKIIKSNINIKIIDDVSVLHQYHYTHPHSESKIQKMQINSQIFNNLHT
jgi:GT2 family glycosyltransferase